MNLFTILAWGFLYVPLVLGEGYYSLNFDARVPIALGILGSSYQKYTIMADRSLLGGSNIDLDVTFSGIIELLTNRVHIVVSLPDADGRVSVYDMYSGTSLGYLSFVCSLTTCEVHAVSSSSGATTWTLDGNQLIPTSPSTVYACYRSLVGLLAQYTLNDRTSITAQCEQTNLYVELAIPAFPETTAVWTGTYTTWTTDESGSVIEQMPTPSADTTTTWTGTYTTWTTDADGSVIEQIPTPPADTTSVWTGTYTTRTTDADGSVIEQIPTPSADTTSIWTGTYTTWTTDADGSVIEQIPTPSADTTSVWTGTYTTWTTDADGSVIEQIPTPSADTTSVWTGTYTTWTTDADGSVIEQIPTPSADTTSVWTGTYTTWTTDADGSVIEQIPTPSADTTSVWTGTYTTWTTDADGSVIEQIPTPSADTTLAPSADTTSIWTGTYTTWTTDADGSVIEQIPTPSADTTSVWTGTYTTWTTDAAGTVIEVIPSGTSISSDVIPTPLPTSGVDIDTIPYDAFNVAVYHYPADNYELANNLGFLTSGYEGLGQVTTATSVGNINFDTSSGWPYYIESNALGNTGSYVNATIEYVGFFQAPANGNYELSFSNIDYNAILFLGSPATDSSLAKREVQFLKPETSSEYVLFFDHGKDAGQTVSTTQYLSAGLYYPLRIVLAAVSERAQLDFQITLPDGRVLDQYQGYVYNFAHEGIESATSSAHETSWSRFTNSTIYSHSSTIGIITSSTDAPHSVINPTAIETTSTDTSISTVAVTTSICDTKDCVKTTVITPNSPLPTQTVSLTTTTIDRSEVVQTAHSAVPSQFAPDAHPSAVTITREQCDAYSCSQATIVSGKVLQTTTVSDSTTVVPLDTPQLSVEASTLETRLKSTQSSRAPTVTVQTSQSSRHSEDVTESSVHVSEFDAQSTSATSASALQAPSSISLQTGGANTLRLSAFLGTALLPMLNVLFI